jgi:hypothetical protein
MAYGDWAAAAVNKAAKEERKDAVICQSVSCDHRGGVVKCFESETKLTKSKMTAQITKVAALLLVCLAYTSALKQVLKVDPVGIAVDDVEDVALDEMGLSAASKHSLLYTLNPSCAMQACNVTNTNVTVVNVTIERQERYDADDLEHRWTWGVMGHPAVQVALTNDDFRINWNALMGFGSLDGAVGYGVWPEYSAAFMATKVK